MLEITVKSLRTMKSVGWAMCISTTTSVLPKNEFENQFTSSKELPFLVSKHLSEGERQGGRSTVGTGEGLSVIRGTHERLPALRHPNLTWFPWLIENIPSPLKYTKLYISCDATDTVKLCHSDCTKSFCHNRVQVCVFCQLKGVTV